MPDLIQVLLVIWFVGSLIVLLMRFFSTSTYVFRKAIIGYMVSSHVQGHRRIMVNAIDDLGNNLTFMMKPDDAVQYKVGSTITVTVPQ